MGVTHAKAKPTQRPYSYMQFAPLNSYLKGYPAVLHHSKLFASVRMHKTCATLALCQPIKLGILKKDEDSRKMKMKTR
jgi:hypothetical protein